MPPEPGGAYLQARDIRQLAETYELTPQKSKGQNFLGDANTVRKIVTLSGVQPGDSVVEVGPGFGSLTVGLLHAGASVTAIEIDPRLAEATRDVVATRLSGAELGVVTADALRLEEVPGSPDYLVANLPYNVAVPVVIHLLSLHPGFRRVLVMVQAEVGWRIAAAPGSEHYGSPSAKCAWWGKWSVESTISRRVFWPEPRVDSVLVGMHSHTPPGDEATRKRVFRLIDAGFHTRRKMSRQALAEHLGGVAQATMAIESAGLDPTSRCETWSLDNFVALDAWLESSS
ncbi:16S rRNA (adenine1518-N6/adenine1519-N6)-dimethyltransferase [Pontimonas salivibrio]|uniref:16S rRNA (Adenine1518-N6/adenine1519-N6)-dimethyltransferase n=1 Tax=Pontimonas salivibrio TaxID=1159327 RepID=A0A2L2BP92_9MICO|nr:16S rRNA (adenine(1518)-N(6)/adenine(1519)-N(6))-dimethyltransferase RsmA [Pontimonas salivibrio]AVG23490.1 16S rRNA (adenine1518-N6/adenine1519-N6)-dimethyltransferase [Pontimonas salivibrio]